MAHVELQNNDSMEQSDITIQTLWALQETNRLQQQELRQLQLERLKWQQQLQPTRAKGEFEPHDRVREAIPPHLQLAPLEGAKRKKILSQYPKWESMPQPIRDDNNLASRALAGESKKWIITDLVRFQQDTLDALRIATAAWHGLLSQEPSQQMFESTACALQDLTTLLGDNAARLGRYQLQSAFEAAGAKGAISLLQCDPAMGEIDFDTTAHTIFQQAHLDAMHDLRQYNSSIDTAIRSRTPKNGQQNSYRGGGRGSRGDRRGGASRGGRGSYNNNNSWRGRGKGQSNNASPAKADKNDDK